jgi:primosomal protein N' (replication factor Y)
VCGVEGKCAACGSGSFGIRRRGAERVEQWTRGLTDLPVRRVSVGDPAPDWEVPGVTVGGPEVVRDAGPVGLDLVAILDADQAARRHGLAALERSLTTWMEAAALAWPDGRVIVQTAHPNDPSVQAVVRGNPERFHRAEMQRRRLAGFPVGAAVFRVVATATAVQALEELEPLTLLVSGAESERVCLLTLDPGRVPEFGRRARELAAQGTLTRVEAEPHL